MTLTFPTIAEQVLSEFATSTKTISIATLARRRGANISKSSFATFTIYTFDDDTSLVTKGRGKSYKVWTQLP
jgi:hypothetical protein